MNRPGIISLLTIFASVSVCFSDDRISTVDAQAKYLTVEQNGALKLYRVMDTTDITVNGAKATLQQLLPGQTVAVKIAGSVTAVKITASGLGSTAASARPLALHSVTVQMRVDGTDRVLYQDGKLWIEHMSAQKPANIYINGVEWSPTWTGDKTEPLTKFAIPVAPIIPSHVAVKQYAGRSKVKQEHQPAAPAVVTISDDPGGADDYEFQISW